MVMENEIRLGDIMDKLTPSDRVVIYNAARQVVYRGYAANAVHGTLNPQRRIKKMGLGMETYRATEQMWDWEKTDSLPEQVPVEQFTQYRVEDLQHILYIRIELKSEFEQKRQVKRVEKAMGSTRTGRNASGHIITAPEMVAEDGSR